MFRRFRIVVLLLLLLFIGLGAVLDRFSITRWNTPLVVAVFPINADDSTASESYVASLTAADFAPLEQFFHDEASEYQVALDKPVRITLAPALQSLPPKPPTHSANVLQIMVWSLELRWWSWRTPPNLPGPTPRIQLFLLYYDPATHSVLEHSTGLEKGKVGVVNLFATRKANGSNQTVIAHELLHTLGATDKYDLHSTQPIYPDGYAEPNATPRYPQRFAELMGGRVPISPTASEIPDSLNDVLMGRITAAEIGWIKL
jgi:hypothetical protein